MIHSLASVKNRLYRLDIYYHWKVNREGIVLILSIRLDTCAKWLYYGHDDRSSPSSTGRQQDMTWFDAAYVRRAISVVACLRLEARQTLRLCVSQPDARLSGSETLGRNLAGLTRELFVAKYFIGWCRPAIPVQLAIHTFKLMNEYFWYVGGHQLAHRDECKVSSNNDWKFLGPAFLLHVASKPQSEKSLSLLQHYNK